MVNGQFQVGPCPVHDMVGSDLDWVGLTHNFLCNFRVGLGFFFEFRVKYFGPYPTQHLIGSGRVFSDELGWVYQVEWPVIRFSLEHEHKRTREREG